MCIYSLRQDFTCCTCLIISATLNANDTALELNVELTKANSFASGWIGLYLQLLPIRADCHSEHAPVLCRGMPAAYHLN